MAIDSGYCETTSGMDMDINDVSALLVKLYADYQSYSGGNDNYAKAVGVAIRMMAD